MKTPSELEQNNLRLDAALAEYMRLVDRGSKVDRDAFIAGHAEVADELRSHFDTTDALLQMAGPPVVAVGTDDDSPDDVKSNDVKPAVREKLVSSPHRDTLKPGESIDSTPESSSRVLGSIPKTFGRYRIERTLGQGAMGAVFLAFDTQLERHVALKIPKFSESDGTDLVERFYREARSAATLSHPNICAVHDIGEIDGVRYITMAYIEGRLLSDYVNPDRLPSQISIAGIIRKVALALESAHAAGVVHRDLKPANIMIDQKQEPVVMDFGLARQFNQQVNARLTQIGMIIGTPAYMPPEQIEGHPDAVGPPCDIYSLGVILYELLAGQLPFQGSVAAVIGQVVTQKPAPPSKLRQGLDPQLETICLKMMAKQPDDRYRSMSEVAQKLADYIKTAKREKKSGVASGIKPVEALPVAEFVEPTGLSHKRSKITQSTADARLEAHIDEIKALIKRNQYAAAIRLLEKMARLTDSRAARYVEWAEQQLPKIKSLPEKFRSESGAAQRLAGQLIEKHDYAQASQLLQQIPEDYRTTEINALLDRAIELQDEVDLLIADIEDAVSKREMLGLLPNVRRLLELKPGYHRAQELYRELTTRRQHAPKIVTLKLGPMGIFHVPAWAVWTAASALTAVAVFSMVTFLLRTGDETIRIEIDDPRAKVEIDGDEIKITGVGDTITLKSGMHDLIVKRGDIVVHTRQFEVVKGKTSVLKITLLDEKGPEEILAKQSAKPVTEPINNATASSSSKPQDGTSSSERLPLSAGTDLKPGLFATEYPRHRSQDSDSGYVPLSQLGEPIGQVKTVDSLENWQYNAARNAVAAGFLKIEQAGEYAFNSNNFYDRCVLIVDGDIVCGYRDGEEKIARINLQPGYVPIVSIGYVSARGSVSARWQPPGQRELAVIPVELLFHDPKFGADRKQESEPDRPLDPNSEAPARIKTVGFPRPDLLLHPTASDDWQSVPDFLEGAKIYFYSKDFQPRPPFARFSIERSGIVYLACYFGNEGNPSGGWKEQALSAEEFQQQGWIPVGELRTGKGRVRTVFRRPCSKGESFSLRCNKYHPPLVILRPEVAGLKVPGRVPKYALRFSEREYVELPSTSGLLDLNGDFTIEFWVRWPEKPPAPQDFQILTGYEAWRGGKKGKKPGLAKDTLLSWVLRVRERGGDYHLNFTYAPERSSWEEFNSGTFPYTSDWQHIALSKEGQTIRLFRNGEPIGSRTEKRKLVNTAGMLYIGCHEHIERRIRRFDGEIKAYRVSKAALYTAGFTPSETFDRDGRTLVLLDFSKENGSVLPDLTDNGHDGAIFGAKWLSLVNTKSDDKRVRVNGKQLQNEILKELYTSVVLTDAPIGYWRLGESRGKRALDLSGNKLHGTYGRNVKLGKPGAILRDADKSVLINGKPGNATASRRASSAVALSKEISQWLNETASLEFWIRTSQNGPGSGWNSPAVAGADSIGDGNDLWWGINTGGRIGVQRGDQGAGAMTPKPINDNQWHHIVLTRDKATGVMQVFLDGAPKPVATYDDVDNLRIATRYHLLGQTEHLPGEAPGFVGWLDEIAVYDYVLSGEQVERHYAAAH